MTIYQVKRIHESYFPKSFFFSRKTMKLFGQTLKMFSVKKAMKETINYSYREWSGCDCYYLDANILKNKKVVGKTMKIFNSKTGEIKTI